MRSGKRGNISSFKATEKTHATLDPKERFPMLLDHIHFLTNRAGWKITRVHAHYTFEQEPFSYLAISVLGKKQWNEVMMCRQIFGFDRRDNSQNKSLHLTYDENAEIEFLTKYEVCKSTNCFLSVEAKIRNIQEKYKE